MNEWMNEHFVESQSIIVIKQTKPNKQQERHLALIGLNGCENEENRNWKKRKKGKGDWPSH